ncbi:hypothetical protein BDV30DRAFT_238192 [Aspergillus minisclerotigenes]|uniref:Uncharacterized protein n=1 Tax=Aspergillus minisclerotigenes TaxID=656917 RepID=A0A5N6J7H8_9EURO|nr:hypothetical protein BDV30DRAFT_238192 [Aspergillus minisclerotigenes]
MPSERQLLQDILSYSPENRLNSLSRRTLLLGHYEHLQNAADVESLLAGFKLLEGAMKISARSEILSCALLLGDGPTHEHTSLYGTLRIQLAQTLVPRLDAAELELNDEVEAMLRK